MSIVSFGVVSCGSVTQREIEPPVLHTADPLGPGLGVSCLGTDPLLFGDPHTLHRHIHPTSSLQMLFFPGASIVAQVYRGWYKYKEDLQKSCKRRLGLWFTSQHNNKLKHTAMVMLERLQGKTLAVFRHALQPWTYVDTTHRSCLSLNGPRIKSMWRPSELIQIGQRGWTSNSTRWISSTRHKN